MVLGPDTVSLYSDRFPGFYIFRTGSLVAVGFLNRPLVSEGIRISSLVAVDGRIGHLMAVGDRNGHFEPIGVLISSLPAVGVRIGHLVFAIGHLAAVSVRTGSLVE